MNVTTPDELAVYVAKSLSTARLGERLLAVLKLLNLAAETIEGTVEVYPEHRDDFHAVVALITDAGLRLTRVVAVASDDLSQVREVEGMLDDLHDAAEKLSNVIPFPAKPGPGA